MRPWDPRAIVAASAILLSAQAAPPTQAPRIPLLTQIAEVEPLLSAHRPAEAAAVLDEIVARAQAGESLPSGLTLERLLLTAAHTHFQAQNLTRAAELAEAVEKLPSAGAVALGEARMIHGLALALQKKFLAAIPVFQAAEEAPAQRDKALLYGALAAREAGRLPLAIAAYNRLLATSARDRDWADAEITYFPAIPCNI